MRVLLGALLGVWMAAGHAEVVIEEIEYSHDGESLTGYLAVDTSHAGPRPGVLVVHEWWGLNDYVIERARMLAELGYVAFAADMYGSGKVTEHPPQAQEWMRAIAGNVEAWRARADAGLAVLRQQPGVDDTDLAAIGYCFGGATVMQLAYSGAEIDAVVSFHGSLPLPGDGQGETIKASVLAAHGEADGFVPDERVQAFQAAMEAAGVDWQMAIYGGARHGFTNPNADQYGLENVAYDALADERSWALMKAFLDERFAD